MTKKRLAGGRKKKRFADGNKKCFVGLYIDKDIYTWVDKEAKGRRASISQVIREAILERMNLAEYVKPNGRHKAASAIRL